ncbi:MAG: hypothetical protein A2428_15225 [Bdellovibrionales bacterium RIFOXYC1_FULL_54_43]|nr:MAG: hypothetical protein A2428_15225 [Bdellovibrionales bacterium RIFOXYC1_FULL_54_43]OFZ78424.1 MAG: hypothetical protein A2603_09465 [Bdellovibrionales bacterium RIFOXYD1_FULL_55_31]
MYEHRRNLFIIAGGILLTTILCAAVDFNSVPPERQFALLFGKAIVIMLATASLVKGFTRRAISEWDLVFLWYLHLGHVAHGQLFREGYFIGYAEGVLVASFLLPLRPAQMLVIFTSSLVIFMTAILLSPLDYTHPGLVHFKTDMVISITVANALGLLGNFYVYHERRKKEELYRRFTDLGKHSAMLFHDIKNLLTAPSIAASLLHRKLASHPDKDVVKIIQNINSDFKRVNDFLFEMEQIASSNEREVEIRISSLLKTVQKLLSSHIGDIAVECRSDGIFKAKQSYLSRALINILMNAAETLNRRRIQEPKITLRVEASSIVVSDNAGGFVPEILEKIATHIPVSDKQDGSGLGVLIIQDYIEKLGGSTRFANGPDGAVVTLSLPGRLIS